MKNPLFYCTVLVMGKLNLIGRRFSRLKVMEEKRLNDGRRGWMCVCNCGNTKIVRTNHLLDGSTKSCGCYRKEVNKKHGKRNSLTYSVWSNIKQRCYNPNASGYENYGGRGIKVCSRWKNSFENFYYDMGKRPSKNHSIDRVNNNGDYSKENCRWATKKQQNRNSRHCKKITFNNQTLTLSEWAEKTGIKLPTLNYRFYVAKWNIKDVLTKKVKKI